MDIFINALASRWSSAGVKRYLASIEPLLAREANCHSVSPSSYKRWDRAREIVLQSPDDSVLWSPCHRGPLLSGRHIVTVHDCINLAHIHVDPFRSRLLRTYLRQLFRNAERVVAISQSTKAELLDRALVRPEKISVIRSPSVIYHSNAEGPDGGILPPASTRAPQRPFFLVVSNNLPHKNLRLVFKAFESSCVLRTGFALVVVGRCGAMWNELASRAGITYIGLDYVSDSELLSLYSHCTALIAPSFMEGHDLPVAEALGTGCSVVCSRISSHLEFYSEHASFFDPYSVEELVNCLISVAEKKRPVKGSSLGALEGSFRGVAAEYLTLFREVLQS